MYAFTIYAHIFPETFTVHSAQLNIFKFQVQIVRHSYLFGLLSCSPRRKAKSICQLLRIRLLVQTLIYSSSVLDTSIMLDICNKLTTHHPHNLYATNKHMSSRSKMYTLRHSELINTFKSLAQRFQ